MSLKENVFVKMNDLLFVEGIIVGYMDFQDQRTYRVLIEKDQIIDADESQLFEKANNVSCSDCPKN